MSKRKKNEKVYFYKENSLNFNVKAQVAGEIIDQLKEKNGGQCNADELVDLAQNENHPLHSIFDWNDATAARTARIQTARILIGSITFTYKHYEGTRAFVSVKVSKGDDGEKRSYVGIEDVDKPNYELQMREEAVNWLKVFAKRYQIFDYLSTEVQQVKLLIDKMEKDINSMST